MMHQYVATRLKVLKNNTYLSLKNILNIFKSFLVDNLKPGVKYSFRVRAKNPAGWGEPSKDDVSVTLKPEYGN